MGQAKLPRSLAHPRQSPFQAGTIPSQRPGVADGPFQLARAFLRAGQLLRRANMKFKLGSLYSHTLQNLKIGNCES
jgi:hypothetical protein